MIAIVGYSSVVMLEQNCVLAFVFWIEQAVFQIIACSVSHLNFSCDRNIMLGNKLVEVKIAVLWLPVVVNTWLFPLWKKFCNLLEVFDVVRL